MPSAFGIVNVKLAFRSDGSNLDAFLIAFSKGLAGRMGWGLGEP